VIAADKATPGKLNMASPGSGSSNHLTLEQLNSVGRHEDRAHPVQGRRARPSTTSSAARSISRFASGAASKPLLDGGKVKALAVTSSSAIRCCRRCRRSRKRRRRVRIDRRTRLVRARRHAARHREQAQREVNAIIKSQEMQEQWTQMGIDRVEQSPEQFAGWLAKESDQWAVLIRTHGIKPE
jgi:tripartite-type tricarboxylate transporter receptor subunit TctC